MPAPALLAVLSVAVIGGLIVGMVVVVKMVMDHQRQMVEMWGEDRREISGMVRDAVLGGVKEVGEILSPKEEETVMEVGSDVPDAKWNEEGDFGTDPTDRYLEEPVIGPRVASIGVGEPIPGIGGPPPPGMHGEEYDDND